MDRLTEAVEDLARALGWWMPEGVLRWDLGVYEDGYVLTDWWTPSPCDGWLLTHHEAMLVLRCTLLGPTRERCPDCGKRGGSYEWRYATRPDERDTAVRNGWTYGGGVWLEGGLAWTLSRSCPACTLVLAEADLDDYPAVSKWTADQHGLGRRVVKFVDWSRSLLGARVRALSDPTGWVPHEHGWAERFLRAMPRVCGECSEGMRSQTNPRTGDVDDFECIDCERGFTPGDADAREQLTRLADQLQLQALGGLGGDDLAQHPDLGVWIALWLAASPCPTCSGWGKPSTKMKADHREHVRRRGPQPEMAALMRPCGDCNGEGTALAGHADAMAEAGCGLVHRDFKPDNAEAAE